MRHEFPEKEGNWFEDLIGDIDLGYLGFAKSYPGSYPKTPIKKSNKQSLTPEPKEYNRLLAQRRMVVEHAIGGLKRFHSLVNRYRNKRFHFEDLIIRIAATLWNFHLSFKT